MSCRTSAAPRAPVTRVIALVPPAGVMDEGKREDDPEVGTWRQGPDREARKHDGSPMLLPVEWRRTARRPLKDRCDEASRVRGMRIRRLRTSCRSGSGIVSGRTRIKGGSPLRAPHRPSPRSTAVSRRAIDG